MQAFFEKIIAEYGKGFAVSFGIGLLLALLVLTPFAGAHPGHEEGMHPEEHAAQTNAAERANELRNQAEQRAADVQAEAEARIEDRRGDVNARLSEAKLKVCERREQQVQNIMARIANRGERQQEVFTNIADRTQAYYTANNLAVDNYDALVARVGETKAAAAEQVEIMKNSSVTFGCEGEDPRGVAALFREELEVQIRLLQDYREAVRELVVAVRTAAERSEV